VCHSTNRYCFLLSYTITCVGGMGNIKDTKQNKIDASSISELVDIAFVIHHEFDGEIPFLLQDFEYELRVLLDTLNFTRH